MPAGAVEPLITAQDLADPRLAVVGEGVDAGAVGGGIRAGRIGVEGDEKIRAGAPGDLDPRLKRNENVRRSGHNHLVAAGFLQAGAQRQRRGEGDVFLIGVGALGAGIMASMPRVDDHDLAGGRRHVRNGIGVACVARAARDGCAEGLLIRHRPDRQRGRGAVASGATASGGDDAISIT